MDNFINQWLGNRVDYDHAYGYQCVDLIKQYLYQKFGIVAGAWGNANDYWLNTNAKILEKFDRLHTTDVQAGDIVPLRGLSGNPYGHIGIATGAQTGDSVEILEQNGLTGNGKGEGGDRIRKRFVPKSRMYGVLRQKVVAPAVHPLAGWVGHYVRLKPVTTAWRVYAVGSVAPRNKVGTVNPIKYNPLRYKVEAVDKMPNSVIINSPTWGRVSLPIDGDAVLE